MEIEQPVLDRNARRRERYKQDPNYRRRQIDLARAHNRRSRSVRKEINHYRIGAVSLYAEVGIQTIRKWHKEEILPLPKTIGKHRAYTPVQRELVRVVADALKPYRSNLAGRSEVLNRLKERIDREWYATNDGTS